MPYRLGRPLIRSSSAVEQPAVNRLVGGSNPSSGARHGPRKRGNPPFSGALLCEPPVLPPVARLIPPLWRWAQSRVARFPTSAIGPRPRAAPPAVPEPSGSAITLPGALPRLPRPAPLDGDPGDLPNHCSTHDLTLGDDAPAEGRKLCADFVETCPTPHSQMPYSIGYVEIGLIEVYFHEHTGKL